MERAAYGQTAAAEILAAARAAGADAADVYLRYGMEERITVQQGAINASAGHAQRLALRVWCDNRMALLTSNTFAPEHLRELAGQAVAEARLRGQPGQPWLASAQDVLPAPAAEQEAIAAEAKIERMEQIMAALTADARLSQAIINAWYADTEGWTVLANSGGFSAAYQELAYQVWLWVENAGGHVAESISKRHFAELEPATLAAGIHERMALLDQAESAAPSGAYPVVLSPLAAADLARALGVLLTGDNLQKSLRPLLRRLGQPIATPHVTLIDDGVLAGGLKSRPFDDEGTPTTSTTLIERGVFRDMLHTLQSAAQLGHQPNGKAVRPALWQQPISAPSNIYFQPGAAAPKDLRGQLAEGLAVVGVLRPGRIQAQTGRFTTLVQGWWVERGEPVRLVHRVPISANIFDLLRNIRGCGNDLQFSPLADGAGAPSLLVDQMRLG